MDRADRAIGGCSSLAPASSRDIPPSPLPSLSPTLLNKAPFVRGSRPAAGGYGRASSRSREEQGGKEDHLDPQRQGGRQLVLVQVQPVQAPGDLGPNRVVERPKVVYNDSTKKYVLYMHIDSSNYGEAKVGVATGDSVCGSYTYRGSFQPLGFQSRDLGLFKDDDGIGYLLTEDRQNGLRIEQLSADYLSVSKSTYLWKDSVEAPAIFKRQGIYYMFGSKLTGWDPNDNVYSTATSPSGPWSAWRTFADAGSKTYTSQTNYVLPFGDGAIYMGDRWVSSNLMRSTYVWLPLSFSGTTGPARPHLKLRLPILANGAKTLSCSGCSGGTSVGYVGGSSGGSVTFSNVSSNAATRSSIRIKHLNGDSSQRFATVTVNGVSQKVAFLPTPGGTPGSSVLNVDLKSGASNTVTITTTDGTWGPDIDRIMIPNN
ncbi:hypothetical protein NUW58_g7790 [Xylaria curta]|uniref:Uncharacterized protein n=1 Tax=Xylaria curta TaxID=42375 RepID=A0ACC1NG63_9PEZI|nr:hypothetical protein NUW58_g7790 [Xylaria curta]